MRTNYVVHNEAMKFNECNLFYFFYFRPKVNVLRFDHLCYGQWTSMVNLKARLPVKNQVPLSNDVTTESSIGGKFNVNSNRIGNFSTVTKKPDFEIIDEVEDD